MLGNMQYTDNGVRQPATTCHTACCPIWLLVALLAFVSLPVSAGTIVSLQGNDNTFDSSGNNNNGSWVGTASYAPGVVGDAFNVSVNNYVVVSARPSLNIPPTSLITLSAYVDPTTTPSSERIIDKITAGLGDGYLLDILGDHFRVIVGSSSVTGSFLVPANTFTLVTAVFDGTLATPTISLYANSVLDATASAGPWVDGTNDLRIGADSNGGNSFVGLIDQVSITSAPEPAAMPLLALGLAAMACRRRFLTRK